MKLIDILNLKMNKCSQIYFIISKIHYNEAMVELSQKIQIAKIVAKDQVYKVQEKWQTSKSGKNSLTKDPAYNAAKN